MKCFLQSIFYISILTFIISCNNKSKEEDSIFPEKEKTEKTLTRIEVPRNYFKDIDLNNFITYDEWVYLTDSEGTLVGTVYKLRPWLFETIKAEEEQYKKPFYLHHVFISQRKKESNMDNKRRGGPLDDEVIISEKLMIEQQITELKESITYPNKRNTNLQTLEVKLENFPKGAKMKIYGVNNINKIVTTEDEPIQTTIALEENLFIAYRSPSAKTYSKYIRITPQSQGTLNLNFHEFQDLVKTKINLPRKHNFKLGFALNIQSDKINVDLQNFIEKEKSIVYLPGKIDSPYSFIYSINEQNTTIEYSSIDVTPTDLEDKISTALGDNFSVIEDTEKIWFEPTFDSSDKSIVRKTENNDASVYQKIKFSIDTVNKAILKFPSKIKKSYRLFPYRIDDMKITEIQKKSNIGNTTTRIIKKLE